MADHDLIEVEVAYALPRTQSVVTLKVPVGTTVGEAIAQSGIAAQPAGGDWNTVAVGIHGKRASPATVLQEHDRVEIYRPLIADPKQARRRRARLRDVNRS
jgi:hypothetical protein